MLELYKNIRSLRKQNNMTQTELALKLGYAGKSMIAKIEAGQIDLSQSKIAEIAAIFNITPAELMGYDVTKDPLYEASKECYYQNTILNVYNQLSDEAKEKVIDYAELLLNNPKYKKHNQPEMVEGNA